MAHCTLMPAFGRTYETVGDAAQHFERNWDFILLDVGSEGHGRLCNKEQVIELYDTIYLDHITSTKWRTLPTLWSDGKLMIEPTPEKVINTAKGVKLNPDDFKESDLCPDCGEPLEWMFGMVGCVQGAGCRLDPSF